MLLRSTALIAVFMLIASMSFGQSGADTLRASGPTIYPLPIFFYTPETGAAGGAAALLLYRDHGSSRASSITGDIIYTQKKQIIVEFSGDQYFSRGVYRLQTDLLGQQYPNKLFGIGNDTPSGSEEDYTPKSFQIKATLSARIMPNVNVGPSLRYESVSMREVDPTRLIATRTLTGSTGGASSGLGFVANWDSRDNTFAAYTGSFYQFTALFYQKSFGGDFNYSDFQFDLRNFFEVTKGQVLAVQAGAELMGGDVPFNNLARFGGQNLLRGYYDGRYRDKNGAALQAEYRVPVWWRFGVVGFAGIAQVADRVAQFGLNRFWFAAGAGVRFAWSPEERINIRLDYGIGSHSDGMYITVTEAF